MRQARSRYKAVEADQQPEQALDCPFLLFTPKHRPLGHSLLHLLLLDMISDTCNSAQH